MALQRPDSAAAEPLDPESRSMSRRGMLTPGHRRELSGSSASSSSRLLSRGRLTPVDVADSAVAPPSAGPTPGGGYSNFRRLQGLSDLSDPQSVDAFLSKMSQELMILSEKPSVIFKNAAMDRTASMKQALAMLESTAADLKDMERRASNHVNFLKEEIVMEEKRFAGMMDRMQGALDTAALDYQAMDASMSNLVASASTIGDRLGTAHRISNLAQSTQDLLQHLWDFSQLPASALEGGSLAPIASHVSAVFTEDSRLSEAAALVQRMLPLAEDLHSSNVRLGLTQPAVDVAAPGTIEAALRNLSTYREHLVQHLVKRFMAASRPAPAKGGKGAARDLDQMRECAKILAYFDTEESAMRGYIAMLPIFAEPGVPSYLVRLGHSEQDMRARVLALSQFFDELLSVIKNELAVLKRVFKHWQDAYQKLVTRLLEEKLDSTLTHALKLPPMSGEPHEDRHLTELYLAMLLDVLEKLRAFTEAIEQVVPVEANVRGTMETLFEGALLTYQRSERMWLALCHKLLNMEGVADVKSTEGRTLAARLLTKARAKAEALMPGGSPAPAMAGNGGSLGDGELNERDFVAFIEWNQEAMDRCKRLQSMPYFPQCIASLFRPVAVDEGPSCLLEQCARHILTGVGVAANRSAQGLKNSVPAVPRDGPGGRPPPGAMSAACEALVASGPRVVLATCAQTAAFIKLLQEHFTTNVKVHLAKNAACVEDCSQAMSQLVRAVEQRALTALSAALDGTVAQIGRVLAAEQKRSDFLPNESAIQQLDQPTVPCAMLVLILNLVAADANRFLFGASRVSFLSELGMMVHDRLLKHMLKHTFNMYGALQWKRDAAAYSDAAKAFNVDKVDEAFEEFGQLANVLIVPPASLQGIVEGSLHMDKSEALRYIALREDYRSARVDGQSLQSIFAPAGKEKK